MLEIWFSVGYVLLLVILLLAFILKRRRGIWTAIASLVVGLPLWLGWEYARPTWTTGTISGTQVRRGNPDRRGNIQDVYYIFMRNRADAGVELANEDSWWWLKRNSSRIFNNAQTAQVRNTEVTAMWNRWRSTLFSSYPNALAIRPAGSWPFWSLRTVIFYGGSVIMWVGYFYAFSAFRRRRIDGEATRTEPMNSSADQSARATARRPREKLPV